jgi:hypothetical protein
MSLNRFRRAAFGLAVLGPAVVLAPASAQAQVGDISDVNYPGWIPSDRVDPQIDMVPVYDDTSQRWRYDFTLGNGPFAQQDYRRHRSRSES